MFYRKIKSKTDKEIAATPHFTDHGPVLHYTRQFEEITSVYKIRDDVTSKQLEQIRTGKLL